MCGTHRGMRKRVAFWTAKKKKKKICKGKIRACSFTCAEASQGFESFDISQQRQTDGHTDRHLSALSALLAVPGWRTQDGSLCWSGVQEEGKTGSRLVESSVSAVAGVVTICCQLSGFCS